MLNCVKVMLKNMFTPKNLQLKFHVFLMGKRQCKMCCTMLLQCKIGCLRCKPLLRVPLHNFYSYFFQTMVQNSSKTHSKRKKIPCQKSMWKWEFICITVITKTRLLPSVWNSRTPFFSSLLPFFLYRTHGFKKNCVSPENFPA